MFYDTGDSCERWLGRSLQRPAHHDQRAFPTHRSEHHSASGSRGCALCHNSDAHPNLKSPLVYQTNFTIEQALGQSQTLTVSYVGAFGRRLLRSETFPVNSTVISSLTAVTNNAESSYNALQVQFQRRLSRGLQVLSSYTWSHSIDNASLPDSANGNSLQPGFLQRERGDSDFDIRQMSSTAVSYSIPFSGKNPILRSILGNWGTDVIDRYSGPTPFNVSGNTVIDPVSGTTYTSRPNLNLGVPLWLDGNYPGSQRVNIAAFSPAPAGTPGSLGRNALRGFAVNQLDVALRREFKLKESLRLQFRTDFFNILNHPSFANPPVVLTQPATFGIANALLSNALSTSTSVSPLYQIGGPRSIQFSLKLLF